MSTKAQDVATIVDAPPIPTWNPGGDVELLPPAEVDSEPDERDLVATLLDRIREIVDRARSRVRV